MFTLRFIALGLGLATAVSAACSSTPANEPAPPAPKPVCPNTVTDALAPGTKCNAEAYICGVGFQCGAFQQQAACTCTKGAWACNGPAGDPTMLPFAPGDDLTTHCVANPPPVDPCPTDVNAAITKCTKPTFCCVAAGKACYYDHALCSGASQPKTDVCTCESVGNFDGGIPYLQWVCTFSSCP